MPALTDALKSASVEIDGRVYPGQNGFTVFGSVTVKVDVSTVDTVTQDGVEMDFCFRRLALDFHLGRYRDAMRTVARRAIHRTWPETIGAVPMFTGPPVTTADPDTVCFISDFECAYP